MKHLGSAVAFIMSRFCSVTRKGKRYYAEMHIPEERVVQLLNCMHQDGIQQDQLVPTFKKLQEQGLNLACAHAKVRDNRASGWILALLFPVLAAIMVFKLEAPLWCLPIGVLIAAPFVWMALSVRSNAVEACWLEHANDADLADAVRDIAGLYSRKSWSIAMEKYRGKTLAAVAALVIAFAGTAGWATAVEMQAWQYHTLFAQGADLLTMTGSTGTRYVVYNENTDRFIDAAYLPDEYKAADASDVAAVITLDISRRVVGTYTNGGDAEQYVYTLSLRSCVDGAAYGGLKVYGGDPPESISRRSFSSSGAIGSKPTDAALENAIKQLISLFESNK